MPFIDARDVPGVGGGLLELHEKFVRIAERVVDNDRCRVWISPMAVSAGQVAAELDLGLVSTGSMTCESGRLIDVTAVWVWIAPVGSASQP